MYTTIEMLPLDVFSTSLVEAELSKLGNKSVDDTKDTLDGPAGALNVKNSQGNAVLEGRKGVDGGISDLANESSEASFGADYNPCSHKLDLHEGGNIRAAFKALPFDPEYFNA